MLETPLISDFFCLPISQSVLLFGFLASLSILPHVYRNDFFFNF